MIKHILSIDVEEWFHGEFTRQEYAGATTGNVIESISEILQLLDTHDTKATFFVVGETLERYPEIGSLILHTNHELGFHGWDHKPLWNLSPDEFEEAVTKFKRLTARWGIKPVAFRAPSCSLDNSTSWALPILVKAGYLVDSSLYPSWTPLYGVPTAPIQPYWLSKESVERQVSYGDSIGLLEIPFLAFGPKRIRIPLGTGFYVRLFPSLFIKSVLAIRVRQKIPAVVSFHSWEFFGDVPKISTSLLNRIYLYHELKSCKQKVIDILESFSFAPMHEVAKDLMNSGDI